MGTAADMSTLHWTLADQPRSQADRVIALIGRENAFPSWLNPVAARIAQLAVLDNVNLEVERPLKVADVLDALAFLTRVMREDTCIPWIGRLSSGGIELAWKHGDVEVEAVFDESRGDRELMVSVGDRDWDAPVDQGDSLFASVVDRLSNSYIEHDASREPAAACA